MTSRIHTSLEQLEQQLQTEREKCKILEGIADALPKGNEKADAERFVRQSKEKIAQLEAAATRPDGIHTLYHPVSDEEVLKARTKEAIRLGNDTFLPVWNDDEVGLPLAFVRSSMFPATNQTPEGIPEGRHHPLNIWSEKVGIQLTGTMLSSSDRLTFAACLMHYRNHPLAPEDGGVWTDTNLSRMMRLMKLAPGTSGRRRVLDSLDRLNRVSVLIADSNRKTTIAPLVEVDFSQQRGDLAGPLRIRVRENLAHLFHRNKWWRFPLSVVSEPGLAGWAGCYFLSHKRAEDVPLSKLKHLSGTRSPTASFRQQLTRAFKKLHSGTEAKPSHVLDFSFGKNDQDEETVRVTTRPKEKKNNP